MQDLLFYRRMVAHTRTAARQLQQLSSAERTAVLQAVASALEEHAAEIVAMNIHTDQPLALSPLEPGMELDGRLLRFEISGTGFLRHMVRTIAGTLVDIGRGNMDVDDMRAIIESRDRSKTGQTAPPQGLMLWQVQY